MAGIPEDLIVEILLRLPVKSLLRLRCVSKILRTLIDSPNFVQSQLNLPNKPQLVMAVVFDKKPRIYYSELDLDYVKNPSPNLKELTPPWRDDIFHMITHVVGHCNGLLCCVSQHGFSFLVLNPFTGKHIQVAPPPPEQRRRCYLWGSWGFGYDKDSDDYKVVALPFSEDKDSDPGVLWICNLKSSTWEYIVDFPYALPNVYGVFVNGALHWIGRRCKGNASCFIFALNLGNLEYFSVPRPADYGKSISHLGVLDGCLYAIYSRYLDSSFDLWVMKEYGLKESGTRLNTYEYDCYNNRNLLFFSYGNSLVKCEFRSFWRKILGAQYSIGLGLPLVYEPSLVRARGGRNFDH